VAIEGQGRLHGPNARGVLHVDPPTEIEDFYGAEEVLSGISSRQRLIDFD
jgi:hypothetical protein